MIKGLAVGLIALVAISAAAVWGLGSIMTGRTAGGASPLPPGAQLVRLTAVDGIALTANYWPGADERAPAVLLLHGLGGSRSQFDTLGETLAARGYAVLAPTFRAHGESGGNLRSFGLFEARDAHAAMAWLKAKRPGGKTGVVGLSLGGAAALLGEAGPLQADGVILIAVFSDIHPAIRNRLSPQLGTFLSAIGEPLLAAQSRWRFGVSADAISPIRAIPQLRAPLLIIGGERDRYTPADETRSLFAAANAPKSMWLVPGADHNEVMQPATTGRVIAFLDKTLRP